jgi:Na+-driven multidrug efflux pump
MPVDGQTPVYSKERENAAYPDMSDESDSITSGPIVKTVFSLAIPVVLGMLMEFALQTINYFWVSRLGPTAQDAVMSSMVVVWTMFASISIVCIGLTAIVARYVGAKEYQKAVHFIKQGFVLALTLGLVLSAVGVAVAPKLLTFMGVQGAMLALAVPYLRILFICEILFFVSDTAYAVFRASGDTRTPFKVGLLVVVINMALDPLLIFGLGPVPAFGVVGAGIATAIAVLVGVVAILAKMFPRGVGYDLSGFLKVRTSLSDMLKIMRISLPMTTQQFVFVFVYWFLIRVVHEFGEVAPPNPIAPPVVPGAPPGWRWASLLSSPWCSFSCPDPSRQFSRTIPGFWKSRPTTSLSWVCPRSRWRLRSFSKEPLAAPVILCRRCSCSCRGPSCASRWPITCVLT